MSRVSRAIAWANKITNTVYIIQSVTSVSLRFTITFYCLLSKNTVLLFLKCNYVNRKCRLTLWANACSTFKLLEGCLFSLLLPANVITYEDLKALLEKSQNLLLVDVRGKEEVDKGRIPGSAHIPGRNILNYFPKEKYNQCWTKQCLNLIFLLNYCYHSFTFRANPVSASSNTLMPVSVLFSWYSGGCIFTGTGRVQGKVWSSKATAGRTRVGFSLPHGWERGKSHRSSTQTRLYQVNIKLL